LKKDRIFSNYTVLIIPVKPIFYKRTQKMSVTKINIELCAGRSIEIETGKIANLANGSCTVRMGDTIVLATACSGPARTGIDFFPLQVDYRERYSAAGRFPGGYIKREGRPSDKEILTCRVTDRPIRPLFPEGYFDEVMIQALLLSADGENNPDVLCMLGASIALSLSELPFQGPIGAVRLGYIDGQFVVNPTHSEMKKSSLELIYAGVADKVIMIEGEAKECSDELLKDAMIFANEIVKKQIAAQNDLAAKAGKAKNTAASII
jgi:polyribonucleotide nucleotidyltransferase